MLNKNWLRRILSSSGRVVAGITCVLIFFWCATESLSFGFSHLYVARAFANKDLSLANRAVGLARSDPEVYRVRSALLAHEKNFTDAIKDLEHAIYLRPGDADLWIELGSYKTNLHDATGALEAYEQATRLSPGYGRAHELLGNCLLGVGKREAAFAELRRTSTIMPALFSKNIELAWQAYRGDPEAMTQALGPQTVHERIALGLFFANHSVRDQSILLMKDARYLAADERQSLLRELLDTEKFEEAYEVWLSGKDEGSKDLGDNAGSITDGSFEGKLSLDDLDSAGDSTTTIKL